ncbi:MAG: ribbon-helix-helix protein, CopG family [Thermovenabulum sp.]|uniref:ribbon-helix-helix protein, CopG family n=1 Tax=Thermovenabulum sp. TaxID=3100335 RepID=UPI003C7C0E2F
MLKLNKTTTVRIDKSTYEAIKKLSTELKESMQSIIEKAIKEYHRKILLENTAKAFANLKSNKKLWQEEIEERNLWNHTLYFKLQIIMI